MDLEFIFLSFTFIRRLDRRSANCIMVGQKGLAPASLGIRNTEKNKQFHPSLVRFLATHPLTVTSSTVKIFLNR